jgi:hypothetical protein
MAARSPQKLPAELSRAAARWAQWRRSRALGARIPESLWQLAVELAARYGVSKTAATLRVDYYALKKRFDAAAPGHEGGRDVASTPAFVELTPSSLAAASECVIEFERSSGAKMRLEFKGPQLPDLAALSRSFWETR